MHVLRRTITWIAVAAAWSCGGASVTGVDATPGISSIAVSPSSLTLALGGEAPLQATVLDESGHSRSDLPIVWSVRDSAIARISSSGVVTARGVGNTQIAASAGGVSAIATLTVQPPPVASVAVQPLTQALVLGQGATFTATPRDVNGAPLSGRVITWTSSSDAVATVSQDGQVVTHTVGTATITATSEGVSGSATVTVSPIPVASVSVQPASAALTVGAAVALTAQPMDANGAPLDRALTWSSDNPAVASVSATGVVTALAPGSATISATSEGVRGTAAVVVTLVPVGSVAVLPTTATVVAGQMVALSAIVRDTAGRVLTDRVVSWTSSDVHVAIVSTTGVVTSMSAGTTTITATSEGRSATSTVTVVAPPIDSVTVQPSLATVQVGGTTTLTATVKDVNGAIVTDRVVTWASSNVAVATVSSTGVVTGVSAGTAIISATSGGRSGRTTVTVVPVPVGSVTVSPSSATLVPTQVLSLSAVVRDANNAVVTDRTVTWTSSNSAVATVSSSGVVTAVARGTATITATSEGRTGTSSVSVVPMPVGRVTVNPATANVTAGQAVALSATVRDTSGAVVSDRVITWRSSNTAVATVSAAGVVMGVAPGTVTITATSETQSGSAAVTVRSVPVATVTLDPTGVTLEPGQTATLSATTKSADGTVLTGRTVTFSSGNVNVASVSGDGVVTAVAPGTTTITAASEGQIATATVTVQPSVANVVVSPNEVFIRRNGTVQLSATAYDASNHAITGRTVTWSTSDDHLATVSNTGLVTARRAGTVTITATIDGRSGTARLTITN